MSLSKFINAARKEQALTFCRHKTSKSRAENVQLSLNFNATTLESEKVHLISAPKEAIVKATTSVLIELKTRVKSLWTSNRLLLETEKRHSKTLKAVKNVSEWCKKFSSKIHIQQTN